MNPEENLEQEAMVDDFGSQGLDDFEASIAEMTGEQIDEFSESLDYEKFIVLSKKELTNFCRLVEPLTKVAVDEYGKSVYIEPISDEIVELKYVGAPNVVTMQVGNKSGKQVTPFALSTSILKKLVTNSYASLIFVETEDNGKPVYSISVCNSLLYVETKPLRGEIYKIDKIPTVQVMDREKALYTFKTIGSILAVADRASEKVVVIKNKQAIFNTGYFAAKTDSPFGDSEDMVVWKAVTDILAVLAEISKVSIQYHCDATTKGKEKIAVLTDNSIYCELPFGPSFRVPEFYNPSIENLFNYQADITIVNDSILKLVSLIKNLDYLSNIVSIEFTEDKLNFLIYSQDMQRHNKYEFPIVEGKPEETGVMKTNVDTLKVFLELTGTDVRYAYNANGLGIKNQKGVFLMRKS